MNNIDLSLIKNSSAKGEIFNSLSRAGSINKTEKYEKTLRKHSTQRSLKYNRTVTFKQLRSTVIDNITRTAAEIFFSPPHVQQDYIWKYALGLKNNVNYRRPLLFLSHCQ